MFIAKIEVRGIKYYLNWKGGGVRYEGLTCNATQFFGVKQANEQVKACPGWAKSTVTIVPYVNKDIFFKTAACGPTIT